MYQKFAGIDRFMELLTADPMKTNMIGLNVQLGDQIINDIQRGTYKVCPVTDDQNQSMKQVTFQEKTQIVGMLFQMFGQLAQAKMPVRWWLQDAPFPNMEVVISQLEEIQKAVAAGMGATSAMNTAGGILDLAARRAALSQDETPTTASPPRKTGTTG
jgi:hypothetical protein